MTSARWSTYIIVPAYNESTVLAKVLDELVDACPKASIVVVDDGSTDDTGMIASARPVHLVTHVVNLGQGAALKTGLEYALSKGADVLVTFDADGQHTPADIVSIREPIVSGNYDVVFGTRFAGIKPVGIGRLRRLILKTAVLFTRLSSGLSVTDTNNGLRALSRRAAELISMDQARMGHALEITYEVARLKLRWTEVPVRIRYTEYSRRKGQSSLGTLDILADLWGSRR
jgi:glycosyltransferase involved in cell wall biosynthesis